MYVGYLRDLSIHGFWYSQRVLEPNPQDTKGQLHVFLIAIHSITVSYAFFENPFSFFPTLSFSTGSLVTFGTTVAWNLRDIKKYQQLDSRRPSVPVRL